MKVLLATSNRHKIAEYRRLFAGSDITVVTPDEVGVTPPAVAEDGATFGANAFKKARTLALAAAWPALADDSGISVDALAGAPGLRSARFGSPLLDDRGRVQYLLECVKDVPPGRRCAHYTCALALVLADGTSLTAQGRLYGEIAPEASSGTTGFGYDPIFIVPRTGRTVADMTPEAKDTISHRGNAVRRLLRYMEHRRSKLGTLEL